MIMKKVKVKNEEQKSKCKKMFYSWRRPIEDLVVKVEDIKQKLGCDLSLANKILDLIEEEKSANNRKIKVKKNFFELDKGDQLLYLVQLISAALYMSGYCLDEVWDLIDKEINTIEKFGLAADFLFARSVAEVINDLYGEPSFVGIGCCSFVAYLLGITGENLDPIEHGLIFERGFSNYDGKEETFCFYVPEEKKAELMERMKRVYDDLTLSDNKHAPVLSAGDAKVGIIDSMDPYEDCCWRSNEVLADSGIGVFQEDYMRILHFAAGYTYEEADRIRRAIENKDIKEIDFYQNEFVRRAEMLPYGHFRKELLFDDIKWGLRRSLCKAYELSVKFAQEAAWSQVLTKCVSYDKT